LDELCKLDDDRIFIMMCLISAFLFLIFNPKYNNLILIIDNIIKSFYALKILNKNLNFIQKRRHLNKNEAH